MPNASLPPPPPPPHCKVLGRLVVASALTLAAAVGGANPAQAAPLPDPPCAATHFEAPGSGGASAKCIPNSGDVIAVDNANDNPEGRAFCLFLGGNIQVFSGNPWCLNDYVNKDGVSGSCQVNRPGTLGCLAIFNGIRDCNKPDSNKPATIGTGGAAGLSCDAACTTGEQAVGGNCRSSGINCDGDEVPNEAGDACVCPDTKPVRDLSGACAEQCGPGEEPDQAMQCGLCGTGHFNADGLGACDLCFPPLTESSPGESSLAGLQIREGVSGRATGCEPIDECGPEDGDPHERHDLELCGPNAKCFDLDPRVGNPNGFTVGEWRYQCKCNEGFSDSDQGDHERKLNCSGTGGRTVAILDSPGGTVSSTPPAGDVDFETRVVFTAAPDLGFMVSLWSGADEWVRSGNCDAGATRCAVTVTRAVTVGATFGDLNECDFTTGPNRFNCPSDSSCVNLDATLGGGRFTCECDEALYDFDSVRVRCGCATTGHLLFGEGATRECKSPVICPSGYGDANFDCVEDEATPLAPEQVASRELCEAFGGLREAVSDSAHPGVCSEVDINDTFCFLEAGEALSCRGLFEHVRDCNALNRPALDPWHCAAACGDKQARGRRCETVTR